MTRLQTRVAFAVVAIVAVLAVMVATAEAATPVLHLTKEQCFLASDAGQVSRDGLSSAVELQNNGSTSLWCALVNQADALVNHSREIKSGGGTWSVNGVSGNLAIWCRAATVDQQTLQADGGTADGGPSGCTIVNNLH